MNSVSNTSRSNTSSNRFEPGTFTPRPKLASGGKILAAQAKIESTLFLRHGEQQLLSLVIPLGLLVALTLVPFGGMHQDINQIFPMALAIALMGAGFTGQAIAVAFDRRYGALKRIGASGVPTWALIGGKIAAVGVVVIVQIAILSIAAVILGWRPEGIGLPIALLVVVIGVATFTSLGLLLGGTLSSEMVLALSNTIWFILMGAAVFATMASESSVVVNNWLLLMPSVALTQALYSALTAGTFNLLAIVILAAWAVLGTALALKFFSFTMDSD